MLVLKLPPLLTLAWLNHSSMNLCIYSLIDLGIHYSGWDQHARSLPSGIWHYQYFSTVSEIFQYIVETPGKLPEILPGISEFPGSEKQMQPEIQ